ncbi:MAG TPA: serine/threonine-protein kinase [Kofleriaceae bacterium]
MGDRSDKVRGKARLASDLATVDLTGTERNAEPTPATAFDRPQDRFDVVGELGRGGMGRVDDAYDRTLGRAVAIKHMLAQSAVEFARFEREARITARLEHPGIVPIHEAGRSLDGTPYYVMRRVDGLPLNELVTDKPLAERLRLIPNVLAACDAAGFAHARGIVHRDIKPNNILIGPFGETLLIDWGLARELGEGEQGIAASSPSDQALTRAGTVAGTPGFMAPEQARGEQVDARADVFALGATLFYVLSGQLPWGSTSATELVNLAGANRAPDWKRVPREVPADLRAVLEKAMAGDLAQRYPDASALAADLRRFTLGNLVAAYEYGPIAKLVRYARKHRAAVGVGLISFVVVAIIGVISVRRIVAERDDAREARTLAEARQRDATAMADGLLVQHARELADTDPAAAIATLRRLRPDSTRWREAWAAAAMAWLRGVPVGFTGSPEPAMMAISPDNRHAFVATLHTGEVWIHDLVARTRRKLGGDLGRIGNMFWLDARYIACHVSEASSLGFIDTTTGALTTKPLALRNILPAGGGRIWVELEDGRVLEFTDPTALPKTVMTGVDRLFASPDLRSAVVVRGARVELWTEGGVYALPVRARLWTAATRDDLVTTADDHEIRAWKLVGGKLVEQGRWPREQLVHIFIVGGQPVAATGHGLRAYTPVGPTDLERESTSFVWTGLRGFAATMHDGRIVIRDRDGRFELGKRPVALRRLDLSNDGRWLAGLAKTGELLVWDLAQIRPRRLPISPLEQPMMIENDSLWIGDLRDGVRKLDLVTGESRRLTDDVPMVVWSVIGHKGRFVANGYWEAGQLSVYDGIRDKAFTLHGVAIAADDQEGLVIARHDGSLVRWRPGETTTHPYAKLPAPPDVLALSGRYAVARVAPHDVVRIDAQTQRVTRAEMKVPIEAVTIDPAGGAWLVGGGKAYQWPLGGVPVEVALPGPVDDILQSESGVLVHCSTAVMIVRGDERRVVPVNSTRISHISGDAVVVFETPHSEVGLLDLETGSTVLFPLKKPTMSTVAADDSRVVYRVNVVGDQHQLLLWTLRVPRDPILLRAWLATITNAKQLPNSDAVAYP